MNWGNKLLVTFLVFGSGMCFLVYRSMHTNFELVEKDYYKTEIGYQTVIDATERANGLSVPVSISIADGKILLHFPPELMGGKIEGSAWFYCPYDSKRDRKVSLHPGSDGIQSLSTGSFAPGSYQVKIDWQNGAERYYSVIPIKL